MLSGEALSQTRMNNSETAITFRRSAKQQQEASALQVCQGRDPLEVNPLEYLHLPSTQQRWVGNTGATELGPGRLRPAFVAELSPSELGPTELGPVLSFKG